MKKIWMRLLAIAALMSVFVPILAQTSPDLRQLEEVLKRRPQYLSAKENRIDSIKRKIDSRRLPIAEKLRCYDELYREYLTFRFDSAMVYINRSETLLDDTASYDDRSLIKIHKALSLATSGHFSQAIDLLESIDSERLSASVKEELYSAFEWTYGVWAEYSGSTDFANEYNELSVAYIDSLLSLSDVNTSEYCYHLGDRFLRIKDYEKARDNYMKVLEHTPQDTRRYAQAAYGLAASYRGLGDNESFREWLINAAISDQIIPLKENLALQELALDIKNRDGDLETANRYLKYSLEDAIFYNNRLRMLEISEKFPDIVLGYQDKVTSQNKRLRMYVACIAALLLVLATSCFIIIHEKKKLNKSQLAVSEINRQLRNLNKKLASTNESREQYVSLFMDLCAAYIGKLNRFQSTVMLKIKARQFDDLLRVANNNARPSDAELKELFFNFDSAFLRLYPDFILKFNDLLDPDKAIIPKNNELLNTDLRIFALIRMGIKDSTKIATLLFYSPQTIFNHRTQVRNRALNRDTFESDLMNICEVMPS